MKTRKRLAAFLLAFTMILSFLPSINVQAGTLSDVDIVSDTEVTYTDAENWARSKGATDTFIGLAKLYWKYAESCGDVNPAIAYVQSAKETGYGKFGGVLNESYHNPCGLKTSAGGDDSDPNAHQRFASWDEGVQAHLDHLALYAGANGYPKSNTYDPRHFVTIKGKATTVNSLGGKWAPSSTYGEEVNKLYRDLMTSAGINVDNSTGTGGSDSSNGSGSGSTDNSDKDTSYTKPADTVAPSGVEVTEPIARPTTDETNISSSIGWRKENGKWYYYRSDNSKATGWINPGDSWYYLYSNGEMATGWVRPGSSWYYMKSSGAMQLGWFKEGSKWYYMQGNGSMTTGFKLINSKKYFLDSSGAMRVGWFKISGKWFYFNSDGNMLTGWIKPGNSWYYLFENGVMASGWLAKNGDWYYLYSGGDMATGWTYDGSKYYYLDPSSGKMLRNTVKEGYEVKADGSRGDRVSTGTTIVIDAGHNYGGDDGAYATHSGVTYCERDLNMQVASKLKTKLQNMGYTVIMTREESDKSSVSLSQSLSNRVNIANRNNADFFISIHHNAASASAYGVETYYSSNTQDSSFGGSYSAARVSKSRSVATAVNNAIANKTGAYNRGAKDGNLFVLRNTNMPAILVECGFITNANEAAKCASSSYQDLSTTAIADAVAAAF